MQLCCIVLCYRESALIPHHLSQWDPQISPLHCCASHGVGLLLTRLCYFPQTVLICFCTLCTSALYEPQVTEYAECTKKELATQFQILSNSIPVQPIVYRIFVALLSVFTTKPLVWTE